MKIIVAGAGEVGFNLAKHLVENGNDITIIDRDKDRIKYVNEHLDCYTIVGEVTNYDLLKSAGVNEADIFIAVTDSDEVNMISCLIVHSNFSVDTKIARVRNIDYHKTNLFDKKIAGFDYLVNPEVEAAKSIIRGVEYGAISDVFVFDDTDIQFREVFVDSDVDIAGKSLESIRKNSKIPFVVASIYREGQLLIPSGKDIIQPEDHLFIVGTKTNLDMLFSYIGIKRRKIKSVIIAGGGKIQRIVIEGLISKGRDIIVVEKDYEKSKKLADMFPEVLVINGDISDETLLEEEELHKKDLIITATDNDEINILSASYYKSIGVKRAIALIDKANYLHMASSLGIDISISPKLSAVNTILKYVKKGNIINIYSLFDGKGEAIEFLLNHRSKLDGVALKNCKIPQNAVIVAITRNGKSYIPDGDFVFKSGDIIIAFALKGSDKALEEFFKQ
ncbi:MAG: Trk system potassium transporter TrkA [Calditerrivibrio sp.]|nr:Trk system potassium transporter TrkA [Calditerrivibrio sp.]